MKNIPLFVKCTSLQSLMYAWNRKGWPHIPTTPQIQERSGETVGPALFSNKRVWGRGVGGAFHHTNKHDMPSQAHQKLLQNWCLLLMVMWAQGEKQSVRNAWIQWQILCYMPFFPHGHSPPPYNMDLMHSSRENKAKEKCCSWRQ